MKKETLKIQRHIFALRFIAILAFCALFSSVSFAQTAGGTTIQNQASATYGDGTGGSYSSVSNTVTVTVANVSGLTITPDAGSRASVVAGQTGVLYSLRVNNTGNFADQVRFLASGASLQVTGAGTITRAVIDNGTTAGAIDASDTNIFTNNADVTSASILQGGYIDVLVEVSINSNATTGSTVNVQLGDAAGPSPYDNVAIPNGTAASAHEVRTVSATSVNGLREARGDMSATVDNDAQLRLSVTQPAGPVALGSNITYSWQLCNVGSRVATSITLGSATGVYIIAPIPVGTSLASGQTFPSGTLYTTSPLTTAPTAATWTTSAPGTLSSVTRVAFNVGPSLSNVSGSNCTTAGSYDMAVTITTSDATNDIYEIGDAFAKNTVNAQITDQSGDTVANKGDGNANFDEPVTGGTVSTTQGFQVITTLTRTGSVLIGPSGTPAAVGPVSNNDDYTNRSVSTGIAGIAYGSNTNASGTVVFTNTIRNTGNANDTFALSLQSAPSGFTVEISTDNGANYTTVTTNTVSLPIAYNSNANILVRVTAPTNQPVMSAYPVVIRATSGLTTTAYNDTIDRLYTGVLRMTKSSTIINGTGVGGATDAVPGAVIEYTITYQNITSTGGTGNSGFTISNLVITEDGNATPNNWATRTTQVTAAPNAPSDSNGGTIKGGTSLSNLSTTISTSDTILTNTVPTLAPGATGTFKFRRTIN